MGGEGTRFERGSQGATALGINRALEATLRGELESARWYQGKGRRLASLTLSDHVAIPESEGASLALVAADFRDGEAEQYAFALRPSSDGSFNACGGDDPLWSALAALAMRGGGVEGDHGTIESAPEAGAELGSATRTCRPLGVDQSNTSLVLDERVVLKLYRRLRQGDHPEQEVLRGLTRVGSKRAPALLGALAYRGGGASMALATAYAYVEGAPIGWEPAIAAVAASLGEGSSERKRLAIEASELGHCAGELHADLLAAFGGRTATDEDGAMARKRATAVLAKAIVAVAPLAPELAALEPAARLELDGFDFLSGTALQRIHGDLHVGQLVRGQAGVVALDFEGDPTLPTEARQRLASPLQDVASLLLSLDHVAVAATRRRDGGLERAREWSTAAKEAVLSAYAAAAPSAGSSNPSLMRALQVSKEWQEAVYAATVLPEWLYAPRLVLRELLT